MKGNLSACGNGISEHTYAKKKKKGKEHEENKSLATFCIPHTNLPDNSLYI